MTARTTHLATAFLGSALLTFVAAARAQYPANWAEAQEPFRVYGDTYYVGTQGLSAILVTSPQGHVLIDGTLPQATPLIVANIKALGFRIEDVKLILNTHDHFDHAGGIAKLQKLSHAVVAASKASAKVLTSGAIDRDDPQYGKLPKIAIVHKVKVFADGETLKAGALELTAHFTPGHTPGGTSWTWKACEQQRCLDVVYADSLNPISAAGYLYTDKKRDPNGVAQLEHSFTVLSALPCDILLTPHPELADLFGKLARRGHDETSNPFIDPNACRAYVQASRAKLEKRIAEETASKTAPDAAH
jgi:metallo-beta-lactamase class B